MIQMRTEHDYFFSRGAIGTSQHTDGVPGNSFREHSALHKTLVAICVCVASRIEPKLSKLRTDIFGCETFVSGAATSSLHRITRQKPELRPNITFELVGLRRLLGLGDTWRQCDQERKTRCGDRAKNHSCSDPIGPILPIGPIRFSDD